MEKLRIGVIGTGHMGQNHVRNLSDDKRFELVGVFDQDADHSKKVADQFGTKSYASIEALLQDITAVVVAVPSSMHKSVGLMVADFRVHALIEKPLALNSADATELLNHFEDNGLILQVGHIERFNPVVKELKKIITGKDIFFLEAHRYSPFSRSGRITDTSVVEDLMIHDIDIVLNIMKPNCVTDIRGNAELVRSNTNDFATCMLKFSSNTHAMINASRVSQNKERTLEVHATDCVIRADLLTRSLTITRNTDILIEGNNAGSYKQDAVVQSIFVPIIEPLRAELHSFYNAIMMGSPVETSGEEAIYAIEICEEIIRKART